MSEDSGAEGTGASPLPPSRPDPAAGATAAAAPDTAAARGTGTAGPAAPDASAQDAAGHVHAPPRPAASPAAEEEAAAETETAALPGRPSRPLLAGAAFTGLLLIAAPFATAGGPQALLGETAAAQDPGLFTPWSPQGQEGGASGAAGALGAAGEPGGGDGFVPDPLAPVASEEPRDGEADAGGDGVSGDGAGVGPRHPWADEAQDAPEGAAGDGGEAEEDGRAPADEDGRAPDGGGGDGAVTAAADGGEDGDDAAATLSGEEHAKLLGTPGGEEGSGGSDDGGDGDGSSDGAPVTAAGDGGSGGSGSQGSGSGSGGGGAAGGPAYSGITGPGCKSDDRTYFWAYNTWYDDPVNSWATRSSGYTQDGCDGLYQAVPVSGDRHDGSGPSTAWTFTPGWAGSHCEVWVYIPEDETPLWVSSGPAKYMINSGGSPGAPFTQTELVQSDVKGTWTRIAEFEAPTEQFTVQLVNAGENRASGQGTAHVASSPMRANCS